MTAPDSESPTPTGETEGQGETAEDRSERMRALANQRWDAERLRRQAALDAGEGADERNPSPPTSGLVPPSAPDAGDVETTLAAMRAIIADPNALDTSKVAAGKVLVQAAGDRGRGAGSDAATVWMAREAALAQLPPEDRLALLREVLALAQGDTTEPDQLTDEDAWPPS